ncbi:MAG: sulfatase-like hydrolase/transferase, partial [Candidatus Aminicenantes bacterium]
MLRKSSFIFILALLFFIDSCTQRPLSDFKVLRFIDELEEKHISQSPLRGLSEQERKTGKSFPAKSFPLQDMGSGENPFLLKRKIKVWREYLNALFAPPETRYDFSVRVEKDAVLECGIGVIAEKNSQVERVSEENGNRDIRFSVFIEFDGRREVLFEEVLKAPALEEKQVFLHKSVDLSPFRGPCRLSFLTSGKEGAFSFWTNPVLYPRQKSHRQVILISIDTLRADHLGAYGYERETSPNIDALASDGAQFMKVYAPSPWTLPSHVSLLTALNCVSHQVYQDNQRMDPEFVTMAELLKTNGFFCSAFTGG